MAQLDAWANFYVIIGSSAGALIGLQFVVITLVADLPVAGADMRLVGTFTTPSVIHFGVVLLLSAIVSAPWSGLGIISIVWGIISFCGIIYTIIITWRLRGQTVYKPVFEDWLFHALSPLVAYLALGVSACESHSHERDALFLVAGSALLLLFVGIHNAWDIATYHIFVQRQKRRQTDTSTDTKE